MIAALSMLAAYFVADSMIGRPGAESVKVKTVDKIDATIVEPDASIFNKDAINPTIPVIIGDTSDSSSTPSSSVDTDSKSTSQGGSTQQGTGQQGTR